MESAKMLHGICIKMGNYNAVPKYRFVKKMKTKKSLFRSLDEFFKLNIFEQSEGLSSILISLYKNAGDNKAIMQDIDKLVKISDRFIYINLDPEGVYYSTINNTFEVDTDVEGPGGFKFIYGKKNFVPHNMVSVFSDKIYPKLEDRYLEIITCVSKTMNNPMIVHDVEDSDLTYFDPFAD